MIELLMQKKLGRLVPYDGVGIDQIDSLKEGAVVTARLTQARNIKHHRLWFALLQTVYGAQTLFPTLDELHDAIKIAVGHCEERKTIDGITYWHPKSISFHALDQQGFSQFFDRAVNIVIEKILPNASREDLEARIFEILGEPGPQDWRLKPNASAQPTGDANAAT
jgi:hypothetical protein